VDQPRVVRHLTTPSLVPLSSNEERGIKGGEVLPLLPFGEKVRMREKDGHLTAPHLDPLPRGERKTNSLFPPGRLNGVKSVGGIQSEGE
jgi:hypothetical protein